MPLMFFTLEAAAEINALAEAAAAAEAASTAAAATTAAETAAAQQAAQAAAATTAAQAGAGAGSGIMSAAPTAAAAAGPESAMAAQAAQGGQGAAAGLEQITQGSLTPPPGSEGLGEILVSDPAPSAAPIVNGTVPGASAAVPAGPPVQSQPGSLFGSAELTGADAYTGTAPGSDMRIIGGELGNPKAPQSAFMRGINSAMEFVDKYPKTSMAGAYLGANALGLLNPNHGNFNSEPYTGPLSKYKLSSNYQPGRANPSQFQYKPRYAEGGIMQMAQGGITGSGNLTLNVPLDLGGGQNGTQATPDFAFGNGNSGANTGYFGQNSNQGTQSSMASQNGTPDLLQQLQQFNSGTRTDNSQFQSESRPINVGGSADLQNAHDSQNFAAGGSTGNLSSTLDYYTKMMEGEKPKIPAQHPTDSGIYHDTDPDTRSLDAYSAARTRLAKTNRRSYVAAPKGPEPYVGGQLNVNPPGTKPDTTQYQEAAKGGIMGLSDLGGYAAGGNPRLLKGPGDGMSDNIPATINGRQPARLADGEFVIPADVVSHLGNGSTEAGAKVLHQMMTKVRQERTGNPHQGKQINPRKYMPR